jgi:hypothetical protein
VILVRAILIWKVEEQMLLGIDSVGSCGLLMGDVEANIGVNAGQTRLPRFVWMERLARESMTGLAETPRACRLWMSYKMGGGANTRPESCRNKMY